MNNDTNLIGASELEEKIAKRYQEYCNNLANPEALYRGRSYSQSGPQRSVPPLPSKIISETATSHLSQTGSLATNSPESLKAAIQKKKPLPLTPTKSTSPQSMSPQSTPQNSRPNSSDVSSSSIDDLSLNIHKLKIDKITEKKGGSFIEGLNSSPSTPKSTKFSKSRSLRNPKEKTRGNLSELFKKTNSESTALMPTVISAALGTMLPSIPKDILPNNIEENVQASPPKWSEKIVTMFSNRLLQEEKEPEDSFEISKPVAKLIDKQSESKNIEGSNLHLIASTDSHDVFRNPIAHIANEIVETEKTYNQQLKLLKLSLKRFHTSDDEKSLEYLKSFKPEIQKELLSLFKNLLQQATQLESFSETFIKMLEGCLLTTKNEVDSDKFITPVIKIFAGSNFTFFHQAGAAYHNYSQFEQKGLIKNDKSSEEKLKVKQLKLKDDLARITKKWIEEAYLSSTESFSITQLDFSALAAVMFQRPMRYRLFLEDLLKKFTPGASREVKTNKDLLSLLQTALDRVKKSCEEMNNTLPSLSKSKEEIKN